MPGPLLDAASIWSGFPPSREKKTNPLEETHFGVMFASIALQRQGGIGLLNAVHQHGLRTILAAGNVLQREVIMSAAVTIVHLERFPIGRQAGGEPQFVNLQPDAQKTFDDQTIEPPG